MGRAGKRGDAVSDEAFWTAIGCVIAVFVLGYMGYSCVRCESAGGAYVQTWGWYACVEKHR